MEKIILLMAFIMLLITSCTEQKEKSPIEKTLDNIEQGKDIQANFEKLHAQIKKREGTTTINDSIANMSIVFPVTKIESHVSTQIIADEEVKVFHYTANMKGERHPNLGYQMSYFRLNEAEKNEAVDELFNIQRDYILSAMNAKLEFEKIIEMNGIRGRHLYVSIDGKDLKANYKMFVKDDIFYSMVVLTEKGNLFNNFINSFFDSFKITR